MNQILEPSGFCKKLLGVQKRHENVQYRSFFYCINEKYKDNMLIYHTMTKELISLSLAEYDALCEGRAADELTDYMIGHWFLVPEDFSDIEWVDAQQRIARMMSKKSKSITHYTILTTTDCNARCFYCYEKGRKLLVMSEATAVACAEYIYKHAQGEPVVITWFGGEPLMNKEAIDTICKALSERDVNYKSHIITNGFLFTDDMISQAVNKWNLHYVQITLDGTREIYNRSKAYVTDTADAYAVVCENIENLMKQGIHAGIRLNVSAKNGEDLYDLIMKLLADWNEYDNWSIYPHMLFDTDHMKQSSQQFERMQQSFSKLYDYVYNTGRMRCYSLANTEKVGFCMADAEDAAVISPQGYLGCCEHFSESHFWGSVFTDDVDAAVKNSWKELMKNPQADECRSCVIYPLCSKLKNCPDAYKCSEFDRKFDTYVYRLAMRTRCQAP